MRILAVSMVVVVVVLAGCSGYGLVFTNTKGANNAERTLYCDPDFSCKNLREHGLAIGGVVLRDGLELDKDSGVKYEPRDLTIEVQVELWTPVLDDVARRMLSGVEVVRWYGLQRSLPDELCRNTHTIVSRRGTLKPALLAEWSAHLPHVTYLAFARIENTWHENPGQVDWNAANTGNRDEDTWLDESGQGGRAADGVIGRVVVLTLDVYDVKSGLSVWSHEVQKHVNPSYAEKTEYTADGERVRRVTTLDETLDDAMEVAMGELRGVGPGPPLKTSGDGDDEF